MDCMNNIKCAKLVPGQTHRFCQRNSDLKFIPNEGMLRQILPCSVLLTAEAGDSMEVE